MDYRLGRALVNGVVAVGGSLALVLSGHLLPWELRIFGGEGYSVVGPAPVSPWIGWAIVGVFLVMSGIWAGRWRYAEWSKRPFEFSN